MFFEPAGFDAADGLYVLYVRVVWLDDVAILPRDRLGLAAQGRHRTGKMRATAIAAIQRHRLLGTRQCDLRRALGGSIAGRESFGERAFSCLGPRWWS